MPLYTFPVNHVKSTTHLSHTAFCIIQHGCQDQSFPPALMELTGTFLAATAASASLSHRFGGQMNDAAELCHNLYGQYCNTEQTLQHHSSDLRIITAACGYCKAQPDGSGCRCNISHIQTDARPAIRYGGDSSMHAHSSKPAGSPSSSVANHKQDNKSSSSPVRVSAGHQLSLKDKQCHAQLICRPHLPALTSGAPPGRDQLGGQPGAAAGRPRPCSLGLSDRLTPSRGPFLMSMGLLEMQPGQTASSA